MTNKVSNHASQNEAPKISKILENIIAGIQNGVQTIDEAVSPAFAEHFSDLTDHARAQISNFLNFTQKVETEITKIKQSVHKELDTASPHVQEWINKISTKHFDKARQQFFTRLKAYFQKQAGVSTHGITHKNSRTNIEVHNLQIAYIAHVLEELKDEVIEINGKIMKLVGLDSNNFALIESSFSYLIDEVRKLVAHSTHYDLSPAKPNDYISNPEKAAA